MNLRPAPMLLLAALATNVYADPGGEPRASAESAPVAFEVNVCLASQPEGDVDPECRSMQNQLPVRFGTFKVQQRRTVNVTFGEPRGIELSTGSRVEFRPISIVENQLHMQLEMPGVVNTRLRLASGRSVILAGPRQADGYLIIEVKPTFAPSSPPSILVDGRRPTPSPSAEKVGARTTR